MEVEKKEEEVVVESDDNNDDLLLTQTVVEEKEDEVMEASSEDESHNGDDEVTCRDSDVTATATDRITTTEQATYSVFQQSQSAPPLSTRLTKLLHNHLLSCIKLPLRLISILFSMWITIILLRIGLIFFFVVVDNHYPIGWDRMINSPGIY
jgi:archaellum component FlaD/FlaE